VRAVLKENSPVTHVQPGLPPFLIVQGSADKTVPLPQSLAFQEKLIAAGVTCDLILIPEGRHRMADWAKGDPAWAQKVAAWLQRQLAPEPAGRPQSLTSPVPANSPPVSRRHSAPRPVFGSV
jgi:dipeptidyl aminopeptidase/acylaminoacyl peptidase